MRYFYSKIQRVKQDQLQVLTYLHEVCIQMANHTSLKLTFINNAKQVLNLAFQVKVRT